MSSTTRTLDAEFQAADTRLQAVAAQLKALEAEKKALEVKFKDAIGDGNFGVLPDGTTIEVKIITRAPYQVKESIFTKLNRKAAVPTASEETAPDNVVQLFKAA